MTFCEIDDCSRGARSARSKMCNLHYQRQRKHGTTDPILSGSAAPTLPAAPLVQHARARGLDPQHHCGIDPKAERVTLLTADRVSCDVIGVHPMSIYGNAWLTAA